MWETGIVRDAERSFREGIEEGNRSGRGLGKERVDEWMSGC